jgi:hypothetical protein
LHRRLAKGGILHKPAHQILGLSAAYGRTEVGQVADHLDRVVIGGKGRHRDREHKHKGTEGAEKQPHSFGHLHLFCSSVLLLIIG